MQKEIVVALIAAGSALLISLVTGIVQFLQMRSNQRREIELRIEQRANDLSSKEVQEIQRGLREACRAIQRVQDEILLLIKSAPSSLISDTQQKNLTEARDNLLKTYQNYHPILPEEDRENLNEARNKVVSVVLGLEFERIWAVEYLILEDNLKRDLERASIVLEHYHQRLLFSALNIMNTKLIRIMESK